MKIRVSYILIGHGRDPRNDIALIKIKWPPLGYGNVLSQLKNTFGDNPSTKKAQFKRYERISYREKISTPICLTFDKINLTNDSSHASVAGTKFDECSSFDLYNP